MSKRLKEMKILSEKGAVTLFVLIAVIFFLIVALNVYSSTKTKLVAQSREIEAIEENYNRDVDRIDDIYKEFESELRTLFIKQSLINSPDRVYYDINEWTNENIVAKVTTKASDNKDAVLKLTVTSKKTGNTVTYNREQINNNQAIITENSKVVVTFGDRKQEFDLDKFDKEIPEISYEAFFVQNAGRYKSGTWTNKETYTTVSVREEISGIPEMYYSTDKQNWTKLNFAMSQGIYQEQNKYIGKEVWTLRDGRIEDVYFKAKDRAGNWSNISDVYQIRYDTTAPTKPEIDNKYNDKWTNTEVRLTAKSSDTLSKVAKIEYSYDEVQWKTDWGEALQTNGNESSISGVWRNNFNGKVYVRATDNAGNVSETAYTILKQDFILPTVNITPNGGIYNVPVNGKAIIKVRLDAEDNNGGFKELQYGWSNSKTVEPTKWENFENGKEFKKEKVGVGTYYLWTKVIDLAGNRAEEIKVSDPFIVSDDNVELFRIKIVPVPSTWTKGDVTGNIIYGNGLIDGKKAGVGASVEEAKNAASADKANKVIVTRNLDYIYAEAMDQYGNVVTASLRIDNIDKVPPTKPVITNSSGGSLTNKDVDITVKSEDTLSGISHYEWFDNGKWTTDNLITKNGIGTIKFTTDINNQTIRFRALDKVGNISEESTTVVNLDKTAPVISPITNSSNGNWTNQAVKLSWTITEGTSGIAKVQYSTDGVNWNTDLPKEEWYGFTRDNERNDMIYIRAIDNAGNISNVQTTTMKIDKTLPTIAAVPNGGNYLIEPNTTTTNINIRLAAQDMGGSGVKSVQYQLISSTTMPQDNDLNWKEIENGNTLTEAKTGGTWYLYTKVIDNAGNMQKNQYNPYKVDYKVVYDANGGTGAPGYQVKEYNKTLVLSNTKPTRVGYDFVGWSTAPNRSTIDYNPGQNYVNNAAVTLYAQWKPKTYTVTYNANGGNGANIVDNVTFDKDYTTRNNTFTRTGYTFAGWNEKADGTGVDWTSYIGKPWKWTYTKNITLYAQWKPKTYTVTYNANGGNGANIVDNATFDKDYTTRNNTFTRTGYTFTGWNTKPDGTGQSWTEWIGKPWKWTYDYNITLYAQWKINSYTLTVNPNGGTWNGTTGSSTFTQNYGSTKTIANPTAPAGYKVTFNGNGGSTPAAQTSTKSFTNWTNSGSGTLSGTTYTFGAGNGTLTANYKNNSITLPSATRTGYTFAGWYDSASGGNKIGNAGAAYTPTSAKTLYAHWTVNSYTLTVNPNGGTWNGTTGSSSFTQNYGSTKAIANPTAPAGYRVTFNGNGGSTPAAQTSTKSFTNWTNSGAGSLSGTTYTFGAGNGTLTANYKNNSITLPSATRTGYTFAGWYDSASGGNKIGNAGAAYTPTSAKTLYAHWTVNSYTLTVNPNGGTWNGTTGSSSFTQNYGSTKAIANPTAPAGYRVTFNGNGGSTPAAQTSTKSFTNWTNSGAGSLSGTTYTFGAGNGTLTANYKNNSITLPTPTRTGYTFAGWYDAASGGNKIGNAGAAYTPTSAKTLYAHWTVNSYTLTVNPNGGTWNGTTGSSTFTQSNGSTKTIANPTAPAGYRVTFNGNGGSTPNAITSTKSFTNWTNSGSGTLSGTTYTFGAGNGTLTANYKNNSITLPSATRTGYTFAGWYDSASGGNKIGNAGAAYTPTSAKTLYAHWTVNSYTLTVNPNGGTWNGTTGSSSFTQNYGSTKAIANPTAPAGYRVTFNGNGGSTPAAQTSTKSFTNWTNSGAGSLSGTTYTFGAGNGTLTANYKNNSITLPTPTRTGYTFAGWYDAASGGNKIGNAGAAYTPTSAKTLYAHWTVNSYTLTVNPNGGTWNGTTGSSSFTQNYGSTKAIANPTAPAGYRVTFNGNGGSTPSAQTSTKSFTNWTNSGAGSLSGTTYTFGAGNGTLTANYKNNSITLPSATRTGYTFAGWYDAASGGNKIGNAGAAYTPTSAKTLYAHWTVNTYTVTFVNGYGGTIKTQQVNYGGSATPPSNPTRSGYIFTGWSGSYTNVTSNRTITAQWNKVPSIKVTSVNNKLLVSANATVEGNMYKNNLQTTGSTDVGKITTGGGGGYIVAYTDHINNASDIVIGIDNPNDVVNQNLYFDSSTDKNGKMTDGIIDTSKRMQSGVTSYNLSVSGSPKYIKITFGNSAATWVVNQISLKTSASSGGSTSHYGVIGVNLYASDEDDGVSRIEYRKSSSSSWTTLKNKVEEGKNARGEARFGSDIPKGTYYFRAIDKYGTASNEVSYTTSGMSYPRTIAMNLSMPTSMLSDDINTASRNYRINNIMTNGIYDIPKVTIRKED